MDSVFQTEEGELYLGKCEEVLRSPELKDFKGKIQLIFTSPPFPLKRKKRYGNLDGKEYLTWLSGLAPLFGEFLTPNGSIVMEMGNAWLPGSPVQSLLPIKALLAFVENKARGTKALSGICFLQSSATAKSRTVGHHRTYSSQRFEYTEGPQRVRRKTLW